MKAFFTDPKHPWREVREVEGQIKGNYFITNRGIRRTIGSSIFFSIEMAEMRRIGRCAKILSGQTMGFILCNQKNGDCLIEACARIAKDYSVFQNQYPKNQYERNYHVKKNRGSRRRVGVQNWKTERDSQEQISQEI